MASFNFNSGNTRAFEAASLLEFAVGSDTYAMLLIEEGTLKVEEGVESKIPIMDRGRFKHWLNGRQSVSRLTFTVRLTKQSFTGAQAINTVLNPEPSTSVNPTVFTTNVLWYDGPGVTTGLKAAFANCVVQGAMKLSASNGEDADKVEITIESGAARATWSAV